MPSIEPPFKVVKRDGREWGLHPSDQSGTDQRTSRESGNRGDASAEMQSERWESTEQVRKSCSGATGRQATEENGSAERAGGFKLGGKRQLS